MKKINFKSLIICIAIPLIVGGLAGIITGNSMQSYQALNKPILSPPSIVFPIVWTILYILMGISLYIVINSDVDKKEIDNAIKIFALQLFFNFFWPIIFFSFELYLLAFVWLLILIVLIILMIRQFYKISKPAGLLQLPYLIWVLFAGYLNLMIVLLNMQF